MKASMVRHLGATAIAAAVALTWNDGTACAGQKAAYTTTNAAGGNEVVIFDRANNGMLSLAEAVPTGGTGTSAGLGNQGAVVLSTGAQWLLAVNAGSHDITVFRVHAGNSGGLTLTDLEPSGGMLPVSVTIWGNRVYVLNAMGAGSITGFVLDDDGELTALADSTQPLSGADVTEPAQVEFSPDGQWLIVTEKATSLIDVFAVDDNGRAGPPNSQDSHGMTPFGFAFTNDGLLVVSEAFGGMADLSAVSSYDLSTSGDLQVISGSVGTTETAACWIAITNSGRFAYTTNTASGSISGYHIDPGSGSLTLLDADGVTADTGAGTSPTDVALSSNGRFLYALNSATGEIAAFKVSQRSGALTSLQVIGGLPATATGLAAR